jgi:phosphoglycerol transferase MdoB-like AlkP superfamily enzyme
LLAEGLAFDNLYATGTRSVRGIEAVVTGFLPTPVPSVVKQPRCQSEFFSVAELLLRQGYETSFLYGGEADFDNMRRFFTGNGFEHIIDHEDFEDPCFEGSWGVSDQDLFRRAHAYFEGLGDTPFFSLVFTSSNHSPWDFPAGEIELYEQPAETRNNAVKYADHALGEFFDLARGSSYWDETVFLVVADHNSRVHGAALVPVARFHIPGVFLGGSIAPGRVTRLASQIDLIPTALSLVGIDSSHPALGRDLTDPARLALPGRAILQFHESHLFLEEDRAVLLRPHLEAETLRWSGTELIPIERDLELERRALAHALWPQLSFRAGDYHLPAE